MQKNFKKLIKKEEQVIITWFFAVLFSLMNFVINNLFSVMNKKQQNETKSKKNIKATRYQLIN